MILGEDSANPIPQVSFSLNFLHNFLHLSGDSAAARALGVPRPQDPAAGESKSTGFELRWIVTITSRDLCLTRSVFKLRTPTSSFHQPRKSVQTTHPPLTIRGYVGHIQHVEHQCRLYGPKHCEYGLLNLSDCLPRLSMIGN